MIWNAPIECAQPEELRRLQNTRFKETIARAARIEFFRKGLEAAGMRPLSASLDDLPGMSFTRKEDLRRYYPFGMLACNIEDVFEIHASSGTTGKPTVVGYTREDIHTWKTAMARSLTAMGVKRTDIVQNAYGYGLFTGGLGLHYGCMEIGATIVPLSAGRTDLQLMIAEDFGSTVLCCTPSFALHLASEAEARGRSLKNTKLRIGVFGAEPWSEDMRRLIERKAGLTAFDIYGLSEIIGPGVAFECTERDGLHINEDLFYPEVVDPKSGEPLPEGERGELVLTSLVREAFPLIRYRTGDLSSLWSAKCECGRTLRKMSRVSGRTDDMLIVAGVNFYPSQVESLILSVPGTNGEYQIWLRSEDTRDFVEVLLEVEDGLYSNPTERERLAQQVAARLRDRIGIRMAVKVVEPRSLERSQGKAKRVFDNRSLKVLGKE